MNKFPHRNLDQERNIIPEGSPPNQNALEKTQSDVTNRIRIEEILKEQILAQ